MHCEQNFYQNILKTFTRHKDTVKVRQVVQCRDIRPHLWFISHMKKNGKMLKPTAPYVLTSEEFEVFSSIIENLNTPLGHVSNMAQCICKRTYGGIKPHDYHVLMQQSMPLVLRGLLQPGLQMAVMRISKMFQRICYSVSNPLEFKAL